MLRSFNPIVKKVVQKASLSTPRVQTACFSSNIVRLGVDVLPPMSQAVVHNGIVYLSGQVDGTGGDVTEQTKTVLAKVDKYLHEAGTDKSKLITSTIWVKDIEKDCKLEDDFVVSLFITSCTKVYTHSVIVGAVNEVWNSWIDPNNKPVRATTEASLAAPNMLVEIQVTAALD